MLVTFPVCHHERERALKLVEWIAELGGCEKHSILVCLTKSAHALGFYELLEPHLAKAFGSVSLFVPHDECEVEWTNGRKDASAPNHMFKRVAQHVSWQLKVPYFWMETDCIPLVPTWLDEIEAEYKECGKPFMGSIVHQSGLTLHMNGNGVYPADILVQAPKAIVCGITPFDLHGAPDILPKAHNSKRIHNKPQQNTFPVQNALALINADAVVFHPVKDGSLIDRLREKKNGVEIAVQPDVGRGDPGSGVVCSLHETKAGQPLSVKELVAELAAHAKGDGFAKARVMRALKNAGLK